MALIVRRSTISLSVGAVLLVGLFACSAPATVPGETPTSGPSGSSTPEPEETDAVPDPVAFVLPATCTEFLGAKLENQLIADGDVFLMGPGGVGSATDRNPDYIGYQNQGTPLYCIYGEDLYVVIEFDVQALTADSYPVALQALEAREFIESTEGDVITYSQPGEKASGAELHALRSDSWITINRDIGGTTSFDEMSEWLAMVTARVYPRP